MSSTDRQSLLQSVRLLIVQGLNEINRTPELAKKYNEAIRSALASASLVPGCEVRITVPNEAVMFGLHTWIVDTMQNLKGELAGIMAKLDEARSTAGQLEFTNGSCIVILTEG